MRERPRVALFAYHDVGSACLKALLESGVRVSVLYTHQDAPGETIWFQTPAALAIAAGIPVRTPEDPNAPEVLEAMRDDPPDLVLSAYYRRILGPEWLALPRLGAFNLHGSLLPKYRGRVPVHWAIIHGETETGVTLHAMTRRADAGDIVDQEPIAIGSRDTAAEVLTRVAPAAARLLARNLPGLLTGQVARRPQDERHASKFGARGPEDGRIDWRAPAQTIFNLVRAVTTPYPGAFTEAGGRRLSIWWAEVGPGQGVPGTLLTVDPPRVATGEGTLEIITASWAPGPPAPAGQVCAGLAPGTLLHSRALAS